MYFDLSAIAYEEYEAGQYSPKLLKMADIKEEDVRVREVVQYVFLIQVEVIDIEQDDQIRASEQARILAGDKVTYLLLMQVYIHPISLFHFRLSLSTVMLTCHVQ